MPILAPVLAFEELLQKYQMVPEALRLSKIPACFPISLLAGQLALMIDPSILMLWQQLFNQTTHDLCRPIAELFPAVHTSRLGLGRWQRFRW